MAGYRKRIAAALGGATVVATAALVAASVVGPAGAVDGSDDSGEAEHPSMEDLRECMEEQGVTLPEHPEWGEDREPLSDEEREALRDAAEECGMPAPGTAPFGMGPGGHGGRDIEGLRECAAEAGIDLPEPGDVLDERPELTDEQRDAMRACHEELGLDMLGGPGGHMGRHPGDGPGPCPTGHPGDGSDSDEGDDSGSGTSGAIWEA